MPTSEIDLHFTILICTCNRLLREPISFRGRVNVQSERRSSEVGCCGRVAEAGRSLSIFACYWNRLKIHFFVGQNMKVETYPRRGPPLGCTARSRAAAQGAASRLELQPPLLIRPGPVQSSWNFYEHWSRPIDFFFFAADLWNFNFLSIWISYRWNALGGDSWW